VPPTSSVPPSQRQRSRPGPSVARLWRIVFVVMGLALIPVIAAASPPDPAWIGGIYDAADGDEIVTLIDDQAGGTGVEGYAIGRPLQLPQAILQLQPCAAQDFSKQRLTRGPPPGSRTSVTAPPLLCPSLSFSPTPRQPALCSSTADCPAEGSNA
jgi:hypothetical protein